MNTIVSSEKHCYLVNLFSGSSLDITLSLQYPISRPQDRKT